MNLETLQEALNSVHGASFLGIDTITVPKLKGGKKNPMKDKVQKVTVGANTMVFTNQNSNGYENMVKRRLEDEGIDPESFTLGERKWGTRIANTPIIEHNGNYYLETIFISPGKSHYELEGEVIEKDDVEGLEDKKVSEESQGGVEKKVIIRTFKLDSITAIRVNGGEYR